MKEQKSKYNKERLTEPKAIAILDSAEELILEGGINSLSISKIATKAKIAKGTVYLYFEDKEHIIGTIAIRARKLFLDYIEKYTEGKIDPLEKMKGIFWADFYFSQEQKRYHQLITFYEQNTGLDESGELASMGKNISIYIKSIIDNAIEKKAIRDEFDSASLTFMFWGMVVGMNQLMETRKNQLKFTLDKSPEEFFTFFVDTTVDNLT
ncbi:TetR/AcrR family transcriptional regulator [uncultured Aquimarina sp.]|uniref:TetR/AcrR family transcriptional regulator n=1 Tax=uncultured Aquimarina sp. TaxID=575652 RepID=UPI002634FE78|nr:TetR/AcrR family transcriptional regulator [uncultured Aquimarina sp.]